MTEQQTAKSKKEKKTGVILNGRFVHRENVISGDIGSCTTNPDEMIACLAAYFELNPTHILTMPDGQPDGQTDANPVTDDMPRFQQSQRDGLQVPKEGKDGTGN